MPRKRMPSQGQSSRARKGQRPSAKARQPNGKRKGQALGAEKANEILPSASQPIGEEGHKTSAAKAGGSLPSLAEQIAALKALHRIRIFGQDQRIAILNRTGRLIARALGWSMELSLAERKAVDKRAAAILSGDEPPGEFAEFVAGTKLGASPFEKMEADAIKQIEALAKALPVWGWGEAVNGFGPRALGTIVALAGDLSNYPKKGHIQKRLGIACINGVRQGSPGKNAEAADWIRHGYSKRKRSLVFSHLVQPLMTKPGKYRDIYLARKAYEQARAPDGMTKMHIHRRAHRDMEQKFIRDLWRAWRRAGGQRQFGDESTLGVPPAAAAEAFA